VLKKKLMASERAGKLIGLSGIILHMWFGICLVSTYGSGIMLESRASKKKRDRLVIIWHQSSMHLVGRASQPLRQDKHGKAISMLTWHYKSRWWRSFTGNIRSMITALTAFFFCPTKHHCEFHKPCQHYF